MGENKRNIGNMNRIEIEQGKKARRISVNHGRKQKAL